MATSVSGASPIPVTSPGYAASPSAPSVGGTIIVGGGPIKQNDEIELPAALREVTLTPIWLNPNFSLAQSASAQNAHAGAANLANPSTSTTATDALSGATSGERDREEAIKRIADAKRSKSTSTQDKQQPPGGSSVGARIVDAARREIGVKEVRTDDSERIRTYRSATAGALNMPGAWCAYFVSWLAKEAGAPIYNGGRGTGRVAEVEAWGKQTDRWYTAKEQKPAPGDAIVFDWNGAGPPDHIGIVEKVDSDGTIHTIEGNSSNSVARREYRPGSKSVKGFVRIG